MAENTNDSVTTPDISPVVQTLLKFYGVTTVEELVLAQDKHIEKLQSRLASKAPPILVRTEVRGA